MYIGRAGNGERYVVCISREVLLFPSSKQMSVCLVKHVKVGSKCDSGPVRWIDGWRLYAREAGSGSSGPLERPWYRMPCHAVLQIETLSSEHHIIYCLARGVAKTFVPFALAVLV